MTFTQKIFLEQAIRYTITFIIVGFLWNPIHQGLLQAVDKLDAIAVIMGILSLCALTGYFAFSYTTVDKSPVYRFFGYLCAFCLTLPLIITWLILYFIATIWIPEMQFIWALILIVLYVGTFIFDNLDLTRMGLDVVATSFFEKGHTLQGKDQLSATIDFLQEGQRLEHTYFLIGKATMELGKLKHDNTLIKTGEWVLKNSDKEQQFVDEKIAKAFEPYAKENDKISKIIEDLKKGQNQNITDSLIADLFQLVRDL